MTELDIVCTRKADGSDWSCSVTVTADGEETEHHVGIRAADLARLDPAAHDPHLLVDRSFRFLLEREPATSIMRAFDLMEIARYFPEFETEIRPG